MAVDSKYADLPGIVSILAYQHGTATYNEHACNDLSNLEV